MKPDYNAYKIQKGISHSDIVSAVKTRHEGFCKATASSVCNPERYGVQLTKSAEQALVDRYGYGAGLTIRKPPPKRTKPNRYTVRFDDDLDKEVRAEMERMGCTAQEFLTRTVELWMYERRRV